MNRFAALAPGLTRLQIVELLGGRERTAGAIRRAFPGQRAPAVSQHLRTLREAGSGSGARVDGQRRYLQPRPRRLRSKRMEKLVREDARLLETTRLDTTLERATQQQRKKRNDRDSLPSAVESSPSAAGAIR